MDWLANSVRIVGLAALAVWEYWIFKQRFATRTDKLRSRQIDGAAAVLKDVAYVYVTVRERCVARQHTSDGARADLSRRMIDAYTDLVTSHRTWLAFLPADVSTTLTRFLHVAQSLIAGKDDQAAGQRFAELHAAYQDVVASVRRSLGEAPLQQETLNLLEQTADVSPPAAF